MSMSLSISPARITAVTTADVSMRLRRPSTMVLFLLLGASAYAWIPHPSSGRALIVAEGQRTVYNAAAIGLGTASLASLFVGLFGFYFLSNAVRYDVRTGCGYVIAATPVRSIEYVLGKLVANMVFLSLFIVGFAITSLAMLLVRGEAPVDLVAFAVPYLLMVPPTVTMVAMLALVFETVPLLAGRLGDVLYFFLWMLTIGVVAIAMDQGGPAFLPYVDISGLGLMIQAMQDSLGTNNVSVGASHFDPALGTADFEGITMTGERVIARVVASALPLLLLPIVLLRFHRFDPARIKGRQARQGTGRWRTILRWLRPLSRILGKPLDVLRAGGTGTSLWQASRHDAHLTISMLPAITPAMIGFAIATLLIPVDRLQAGVLPWLFAVLAISIAGIACRDQRAGTQPLLFAAPRLAHEYVIWKLSTTLIVSVFFVAVPAIRLAVWNAPAALTLVAGTLFVAAAATSLGVLTHNPKTFVVLFLSFWYLVLNDGGRTPMLDFAGFYGPSSSAAPAVYGTLAIGFLAVAHVVHRARRNAA